MKKFMALFLAFCILAMQTACGFTDTSSSTKSADGEVTEAINQIEGTANPTEEIIGETEIISETVIYDENDVKITVKGFDDSDSRDAKVLMLVENNTDKNIAISGDYFAINGITMWSDLYIKAAAGKKANGALEIDRDDMELVGIKTIATISTKGVRIVDTDSFDTLFSLGFELETSAAEGYVQEVDEEGMLILDQDGILVVYKGTVVDDHGETELLFFVKNNTDKDVVVTVDDVSVNDFMIYGDLLARVYSNTVCYEFMDFFQDDMEKNGIENIENVSFAIRVYEQETYDTIFKSDAIDIDIE